MKKDPMMSSAMMSRLFLVAGLLFAAGSATAQSLPVQVDANGNTATVDVGLPGASLADLTLTFDDATGLDPASLGASAELLSLDDADLLARLPDLTQTQLDAALPLLVTIEPPASGGLSFNRTVRVEVHTHALDYTAGSSYRLFKAQIDGPFRDITDEIAPGSVRARGTTGGFSQFLVLADVRDSGTVIAQKFDWLRSQLDALSAGQQDAFSGHIDAAEAAVADGRYADAIAALDTVRAQASEQAGDGLGQQWSAGGDSANPAGEILAGAATLKFSVAYLRDYGQ